MNKGQRTASVILKTLHFLWSCSGILMKILFILLSRQWWYLRNTEEAENHCSHCSRCVQVSNIPLQLLCLAIVYYKLFVMDEVPGDPRPWCTHWWRSKGKPPPLLRPAQVHLTMGKYFGLSSKYSDSVHLYHQLLHESEIYWLLPFVSDSNQIRKTFRINSNGHYALRNKRWDELLVNRIPDQTHIVADFLICINKLIEKKRLEIYIYGEKLATSCLIN